MIGETVKCEFCDFESSDTSVVYHEVNRHADLLEWEIVDPNYQIGFIRALMSLFGVTALPQCVYCCHTLDGGHGGWFSIRTVMERCAGSPTSFHEVGKPSQVFS